MFKSTVAAAALSIMGLATIGLTACSQAAPPEETATTAISAANLPETCKDHYLLAALPAPAPLGGKPLTQIDCQGFSVTMTWGEPGTSTQINLIDSQGPKGDAPEAASQMMRELPMQAAKTALAMTAAVADTAKTYPASMDELGGPDYLPYVTQTPEGLSYSVEVEPKDSGGKVGSVIGVLKDRYVVTLLIEQDHLEGLAAGEAAYAPYLAALKLGILP